MSGIHVGARLEPHFRDFLPEWIARQPWFRGRAARLEPIGFFRFEDPTGDVGLETHLLSDGTSVYQVPLTYRGAPLDGHYASEQGLVARAQHSVLGARWIYDAPVDPVWMEQVVQLVRTEGRSTPSRKRGAAPAAAWGRSGVDGPVGDRAVVVDLDRRLTAGAPVVDRGTLGVVLGSWCPGGIGTAAISGRLAVLRPRRPEIA